MDVWMLDVCAHALQPASTAAFALYVDQAQLPSFSEIQYRVTVRDNSVPLRVTISWLADIHI